MVYNTQSNTLQVLDKNGLKTLLYAKTKKISQKKKKDVLALIFMTQVNQPPLFFAEIHVPQSAN